MLKLEPSWQLEGEAEEEDERDVLCRVLSQAQGETDGAVPLRADGHNHEDGHALRVQGTDEMFGQRFREYNLKISRPKQNQSNLIHPSSLIRI